MLSCVPLLCPGIIGTCRPVGNRNVWTRPNSPIKGTTTNSVLTDKDLYPDTGLGPVRASTPFHPGTGSAARLGSLCYCLNMKRWTKSRNIRFMKLKLFSVATTALTTDNVDILTHKPPTFWCFRRTEKSDYKLRQVRLCVCPSIWSKQAPARWIVMK
jgi:hypothetical protein